MMQAPSAIQTSRLLLTPPLRSDAQAIFDRYAGDEDVTRYVGWPRHQTVDDTLTFIQFSQTEWKDSCVGPYLIRDRATHQLLGSTGLSRTSAEEAATGYVLAKDAWGRGLATEALMAMLQVARDLGLTDIFAQCHPDHQASRRVLEKAGFSLDPESSEQVEFPNLKVENPQDAVCYRHRIPPRSR